METELFQLFEQTTGVCIDTRKIKADCMFICIKGENFDGNTFAAEALEKGAKFVITEDQSDATKHLFSMSMIVFLFYRNWQISIVINSVFLL